ncbi:MAG: hypothetical protein RJAPGHWK_000903 [Candidatus Fervidibacter sp.]
MRVLGKSWDQFCIVADSHSNKEEQPDAPFAEKTLYLLLERLLAAKMTMAMSATANGSYSRRDFPNIPLSLLTSSKSWAFVTSSKGDGESQDEKPTLPLKPWLIGAITFMVALSPLTPSLTPLTHPFIPLLPLMN